MPIELQVQQRCVLYKTMICDIEREYPHLDNLSHAPTLREKEVIVALDGYRKQLRALLSKEEVDSRPSR
jgi:hypothetical protein